MAKKETPEISYPTEDQALLMVYLEEISKYAFKENLNKKYKNFIRANVEDVDNNPYFVNSLFNQKKTNRFNNANSALISAMVPKIKIYKVIEIPDNPSQTDYIQRGIKLNKSANPLRKTYSFLLPFENFINTKDLINNLSDEFGKSFGTAIENINVVDKSWTASTSNITIEAKIKVSTFDSIFEEHLVASEEDKNVLANVRILDLFHRDTNTKSNEVKLIDDLFRLKIVIGWSYDFKMLKKINFGSKELTKSDIQDLKAALERCFVTYYCVYTTFNVDIEETGKVGITIKYVGNNQIIGSREVDVMYTLDSDGYAVTQQTLLKHIARREELKKVLTEIEGKKLKDEKEKELLEKKLKAEFKRLEREQQADKYAIQKGFLEKFLQNSKIYEMTIDKKSIDEIREGLISKEEDVRKARGWTLYLKKKTANFTIESIGREKKFESLATKDFNKEKLEEQLKKLDTTDPYSGIKIVGPNRKISFLFLGDILEYLFGALKVRSSVEFRNIIPIVGNFCSIEPENPTKIDPASTKKETPFEILMGKSRIYNYCDLPISMQRFKKFLFENIVMREVQNMSLEHFLTTFFKECVNDIVNANIFGSNIRRVFGNVMIGESNLRTVTVENQQIEFFSRRKIQDVWERAEPGFDQIDVKLDMNPPLFDQENNSENYIVNYMYIYSKVMDRVTGKILNYDDRDSYGIIDIHVGRDRGLVKKINFSKNNIKGLAESAFKDSRQPTKASPFYLQGVMNADIEMFGNPFFKAGSMVYINPSFMLKDPGKPLSRQLMDYGMGGYYQVTQAVHDISPNGFSTKIVAVFNHFGNGKALSANPEPEAETYTFEQLSKEIDAKRAETSKETEDSLEPTKPDPEEAKTKSRRR